MSTLQRVESTKLVNKYCRTFGVTQDLLKTGVVQNRARGEWEWSVWCPSRPELPVWGMGSDEDWESKPVARVLVSKRRR